MFDGTQPIDQQALALTHAIGLRESSNDGKTPNYNAKGDAGTSKGAYQWQPGNFESAAKTAGLDPHDFSPANQDKVAYSEVKAYKEKGYDPGQIASMWNSGSPNNWQNHSGTTTINGQKIHYDTPKYVQDVKNYYQKLSQSSNQSENTDTSEINPDGSPKVKEYVPQYSNIPSASQNNSKNSNGIPNVLGVLGNITGTKTLGTGLGMALNNFTGQSDDILKTQKLDEADNAILLQKLKDPNTPQATKDHILQTLKGINANDSQGGFNAGSAYEDATTGGMSNGDIIGGGLQAAVTVPGLIAGAGAAGKLASSGVGALKAGISGVSGLLSGGEAITAAAPVVESATGIPTATFNTLSAAEKLNAMDQAMSGASAAEKVILQNSMKEIGPAVLKEAGAGPSLLKTLSKGALKFLMRSGLDVAGLGALKGLLK